MGDKRLILVIGATGAQGMAVIDKLLAPAEDGSPSPYAVRALTRNLNGQRSKELASKSVVCVQGNVNEMIELWCGVRISELAQQAGVRHCVYSAQDYVSGLRNWNPKYKCHHSDGKGYAADWMKSQPSMISNSGMTWSIVHTVPYMEMFHEQIFRPVKRREDGTVVFAAPVGSGRMPIIALSDIRYYARYMFDNRATLSGAELKVTSDIVSWDEVAATFAKVTGQKAEYLPLSEDQWFSMFLGAGRPFAGEPSVGEGSITWRQNFSAWWAM